MPAMAQTGDAPSGWRQHELTRPFPPVVTPAPGDQPVPPPSDAIVLFDGTDLSAFVTGPQNSPQPARWTIRDGYMEVAPGTGSIRTKEAFGDIQLHVEWASPGPPFKEGQNRGNSGIIIMGQYEIQVLDSYDYEDTYADGMVASVYGQYPPLVNASRPPQEWQTYDIFFRRPRFNDDGTLLEPARVTVLHNGVLVQNNEVLYGPTSPPPPYGYTPHADELPLTIQDHNELVRYRNIWIRRIEERPEPGPDYRPAAVALTPAQLQGTAGSFYRGESQNPAFVITIEDGEIMVRAGNNPAVRGIPSSLDRLWLTGRPAELELTRDANGVVTAVNNVGSNAAPAVRRD